VIKSLHIAGFFIGVNLVKLRFKYPEKNFMPCKPLFIRLAGHRKRLHQKSGSMTTFL